MIPHLKKNKLPLLLLPLFFIVILAGCNYMEEISPSESPIPQAEIGGGEGEGESPCEGIGGVFYDITVDFVDPSDYPGGGDYEFAVECTGAAPVDIPAECTCIDNVQCLVLSFPISYVSHAGYAQILNGTPTAITPIPIVNQSVYQGFEPHPAGPGGTSSHKICNYETDVPYVIFFNLPEGFPPGMDPLEAISDQFGICIVGDYPDPEAPDPDSASGNPSTFDSTGTNP